MTNTRTRRSKAERRTIVESVDLRIHSGGMSHREATRLEGIADALVHSWRRKLRQADGTISQVDHEVPSEGAQPAFSINESSNETRNNKRTEAEQRQNVQSVTGIAVFEELCRQYPGRYALAWSSEFERWVLLQVGEPPATR